MVLVESLVRGEEVLAFPAIGRGMGEMREFSFLFLLGGAASKRGFFLELNSIWELTII